MQSYAKYLKDLKWLKMLYRIWKLYLQNGKKISRITSRNIFQKSLSFESHDREKEKMTYFIFTMVTPYPPSDNSPFLKSFTRGCPFRELRTALSRAPVPIP